jgi:hypothetical protein
MSIVILYFFRGQQELHSLSQDLADRKFLTTNSESLREQVDTNANSENHGFETRSAPASLGRRGDLYLLCRCPQQLRYMDDTDVQKTMQFEC